MRKSNNICGGSGTRGAVSPDLAALSKLQWAHITHIPYENLDILAGIPLSLKTEDLFRKIVEGKRGGYCFGLQGLYGELLKASGFHVTQYSARFMDEPGIVQMRRHRVLVVRIGEERYVTDVGIRSESPRIPVKLACGRLQSDGICEYRFRQDPFYGWVLCQKERGKQLHSGKRRVSGIPECKGAAAKKAYGPGRDRQYLKNIFWLGGIFL